MEKNFELNKLPSIEKKEKGEKMLKAMEAIDEGLYSMEEKLKKQEN